MSAKTEEKTETKAKDSKSKKTSLAEGEEPAATTTDELVQIDEDKQGDKPEILMTGATHARELISTSLNVYEMLKLLKHGAVEKDPKFEKLLN